MPIDDMRDEVNDLKRKATQKVSRAAKNVADKISDSELDDIRKTPHGTPRKAATPPKPAVPKAPAFTEYTVASGDSLSKIAKEITGNAGDWQKIYEANKSTIGENPSLIKPGQVLKIPTSLK